MGKRESAQRKMQELFAEGDDTLSVSALAKQVGYSEDSLRSAFPEICKQFADRRRTKLREQHIARIAKICDEIRLIIIELHGKGIYPSANKILDMASYKFALLTKEGHDTWKGTLRELGY
jgi:hypothetical protein